MVKNIHGIEHHMIKAAKRKGVKSFELKLPKDSDYRYPPATTERTFEDTFHPVGGAELF